MNRSIVGVLSKTYPFILFRIIVLTLSILPAYYGVFYGIDFGRKIFGSINIVVDLGFAYIGLTVFVLYTALVRSIILHVITYAHIAGMVLVLQNKRVSLVGSFKLMLTRFGSVSLFYAGNKIIRKTSKEISNWIVNKSKLLPDFMLKGTLFRIASKTIESLINSMSEIVMAYLYMNPTVGLWEGVANSLTLYMQSWKKVIKSAIVNVVLMKVFSKIINLILLVGMIYVFWGSGIKTLISFYLLYKIVIYILSHSIVIPYQTTSMLIAYMEFIKDKEVSKEVSEKLLNISQEFGSVFDMANKDGVVSDAILSEIDNLEDKDDASMFSKMGRVLDSLSAKKGD